MLSAERWTAAIKSKVDVPGLAREIAQAMQDAYAAAPDGQKPTGQANHELFLGKVIDAVAAAFAEASVAEITDNAEVPINVSDVGLQSYTVGGPPIATTGTLVATRLGVR